MATVTQSGTMVSGTWSSAYQKPIPNSGGQLFGSKLGTSITINLTPSVPTSCPYRRAPIASES
jgi:hypothetical protein